jgi:hypothetical protein
MAAAPTTLPTVVNLDVLRAEGFEVFGDPFGVALGFGLGDAAIIIIPSTPAGGGHWVNGFVDWFVKADA